MRNLLILTCILATASCVQPAGNETEIIPNGNSKIGLTMEQLLTPKEGVTPAKDLFSGSLYKTNTSDLFFKGIKFDKDTNICFFTLSEADLPILSCLRKVTGNTIEFDFSPYYSRVKNYTIEEHCTRRVAEMKHFIKIYEKKLKEAATQEEKTRAEEEIAMGHKILKHCLNALINKNYTEDIMKDYKGVAVIEKKAAEVLKTLEPVTAEISSDNNSITLKKMLKSISHLDEKMPEYVENIVFIKQ